MNAMAVDRRDWSDAVLLSDHEALSRIVEYARVEAQQIGAVVCAEFLTAALVSLAAQDGTSVRLPSMSTTWL